MSTTPVPGETVAEKFSGFNIVETTYKHIGSSAVPVSILVPKDIKPGRAPVAVHWHGGGLVVGHRLFPDWHADWTLEHALQRGAIVVSPDYRLLPEAKGVDILHDAKDLYAWLFADDNLQRHLPQGVEPGLKQILVTGESAGGWHAVQAGFLIPERTSAIVAQYPMIDMRAPWFTQSYHKDLFDPPAPQLPQSVLDDHLSALTGSEVVTSRTPPDGVQLLLVAFQSGRFGAMLGPEAELYPLEMLEKAQSFPPLWTVHGTADNVVPVEGTTKFVDAFRKQLPVSPLVVTLREGEAHGFDNHDRVTGQPASLQTQWVADGVKFLDQYWR